MRDRVHRETINTAVDRADTQVYYQTGRKLYVAVAVCVFLLTIACGVNPVNVSTDATPSRTRPTVDPAIKLSVSTEAWQRVTDTEAYNKLPETSLAAPSSLLVATDSKAQPLPVDEIPTNVGLRVLAANQNSDWLLVLYQGVIGWVQQFYTVARLGNALIPTVPEAPSNCTAFMAAKVDASILLQVPSPGTVHARGIIYRPTPGSQDQSTFLSVSLTGNGRASEPTFTIIPLQEGGELVLFTVAFSDVDENSSIAIQLLLEKEEPISSQISFFQNNFNPETDAVAGVTTATPSLKIRSGPGRNFDPPITKVPKGTPVILYGWAIDTAGEKWWFIRTNDGLEGWVYALYVEEEESTSCIPEKLNFPK